MSIRAFIFDLDGVITDTAIYHFQAWQRMANRLGISFTEEDNEALKGVSRRGSIEWILAKGGQTLPEEEIEQRMFEKNEDYKQLIGDMNASHVFEGVQEILTELRARNFKIGLASASKNAQTILTQLELTEAFDYVADAASIPNSKPAPDIFLDVMQAFSFRPDECIGIEDAVAGISSIKSAGMFAVGIGDRKVLTDADLVFEDMRAFEIDAALAHAYEG